MRHLHRYYAGLMITSSRRMHFTLSQLLETALTILDPVEAGDSFSKSGVIVTTQFLSGEGPCYMYVQLNCVMVEPQLFSILLLGLILLKRS